MGPFRLSCPSSTILAILQEGGCGLFGLREDLELPYFQAIAPTPPRPPAPFCPLCSPSAARRCPVGRGSASEPQSAWPGIRTALGFPPASLRSDGLRCSENVRGDLRTPRRNHPSAAALPGPGPQERPAATGVRFGPWFGVILSPQTELTGYPLDSCWRCQQFRGAGSPAWIAPG